MAQSKLKSTAGTAKASHSVRTTDAVWNKAKARTDAEGTTMNAMINELMDGYGRGMIDLPKVTKTYRSPAAPATTVAQ
jgi:hypothetical protein